MSVRVAVNSVDDDSGDSVVDGGPPPTTPDRAGETAPRSSIHAPQRNVAVVVALGVLITAGLSFGAYSLHDSNEDRLLKQRVREVGLVASCRHPRIADAARLGRRARRIHRRRPHRVPPADVADDRAGPDGSNRPQSPLRFGVTVVGERLGPPPARGGRRSTGAG